MKDLRFPPVGGILPSGSTAWQAVSGTAPDRHGQRPGKPARCPLEEQECWEEAPPGSAGVPLACTAVSSRSVSCDIAPGHPAGENGMGMAEAEPQEEAPPGSAGVPPACTAVSSRSVPLGWRTRPPCRRERHGHGRSRAPGGGAPGSAGVPPACCAVACRSVPLGWRTRPPCRRERHGHGRSRAPGGGAHPGARASRPHAVPLRAAQFPGMALPDRPHPMTSSQQWRSIGRCVCSWFVFNNHRQVLPHHDPPGWPLITGH